ncbi:MAG TPA: NAD(P)-dependent oxidoreductase [Vicinamibacteria bacterium]|nr:NAD(P)-dependent oxidoreductase [Vicinamibacteria bacterium]
MRVLVAGATGAMGRPLVRLLRSKGHEVFGLTRGPERVSVLEALGARPLVADALDAAALQRAVNEARPTEVVHLLTALPPMGPLRARDLVATNSLRVRGTGNLLRASIAAGVRRVVVESFAGVYGAGRTTAWTEEDPLPPPNGPFAEAVRAMRSLEHQAATARVHLETVTLRFGVVYGPEVPATIGVARRLRRRRLFLPRGADGVASFVHVDDAATAILAALENAAAGLVYNVADDQPTRIVDYLALAAEALGVSPPRSAPVWVARMAAPLLVQGAFTRLALSNTRARAELGWAPSYPTLREGIAQVVRSWQQAPPG